MIKLKSNLLVTWAAAGTLGNTIHTINIAGGSPSFVPTAKIKGDGITVVVNRTLGGGAREVKPCLPRLGTPALGKCLKIPHSLSVVG